MLQQQQYSYSFPVRQLTHEGERPCNVGSEGSPLSGPTSRSYHRRFHPSLTTVRTPNAAFAVETTKIAPYTPTTAPRLGSWIRYLHKDHEAEWKLVLAVRRRSAQAKSQRTEELVEASGSTPQPMGRGPGRPVKTGGPPHGQGGAAHDRAHNSWAARPGPAHHIFKFSRPGTASPGPSHFQNIRPGPARLIAIFSPAWPGPDHRPITSPGVFASTTPAVSSF